MASNLKPGAINVTFLTGRRMRILSMIGMALLLVLIILLAASIGSVHISLPTTFKILADKLPFVTLQHTWDSSLSTIILDLRLPRVILAGMVGAALALAGATYQGLFRNPLADPYLIGVAQGASVGAIIGFLLPVGWGISGLGLVPLLAFAGAITATLIVYMLARVGNTVPVTTLILSGVALSALLSSISSYLIINSGNQMHGIIFWLMGSFSASKWSEVGIALPYIAVGSAVILMFSRMLNVMQLDEEQAQQLGVNVEKFKLLLLAAATLITAASVSFVGTIGFVGIIIPHAVRLIWGADHRYLLPLALLTGAVFMILADLLSRTLLAPTEIPIGVITAICGAPFFMYLLRRRKRAIF
jgi:iron complex transport system permease protein